LLIRTLVMFLLAGLFGIIVATRVNGDDDFKERIINFSAKWVIPGAILIPFLVFWYWNTMPDSATELIRGGVVGMAGGKLEIISRYFWLTVVSGALIVFGTLFMLLRPRAATAAGAIALFIVAQFGFLGGEFVREMARKPYVVYGVLFSNGLWVDNSTNQDYMTAPYLQKAHWNPDVEPLSLDHGAWLFRLQCVNCHTRNGYRSIRQRTADWTGDFAYKWLKDMDQQGVMPPFQGTREDRAALAAYLMSLQGQEVSAAAILATDQPPPPADSVETDSVEITEVRP
jgi:hypothetical protein